MEPNHWPDMKINLAVYGRNRHAVDQAYQDQFVGRHAAWHRDGTHVVAVADTGDELDIALRELGIADDEVVREYIPEGNWF